MRFQEFCRRVTEDPDVQIAAYNKALDADTSMLRFLAEHAHGRPAQVVHVTGEVDILVNNVYGPNVPTPKMDAIKRIPERVVEDAEFDVDEGSTDPNGDEP
jgi:hypothetical protein